MRAALQSRAVLERVPAASRFAAADGSALFESDLGWLLPTTGSEPPLLREQLRRCRVAEFVDGDGEAAAARYDQLLAPAFLATTDGELTAASVMPLLERQTLMPLLQAAWQAERSGERARCDRLVELVDALLQFVSAPLLRDPAIAEALCSATLLDARTGREIEDGRFELLTRAPRRIAAPTLARLAELPQLRDRAALEAARTELDRVAARRSLLRRAHGFVRESAHLGSPQVLGEGRDARVVLWFPQTPGDDRAGVGAIVAPQWLATLRNHDDPALPPVPAHGRLVFAGDAASDRTADAPHEAETVLDGAAWLVSAPPASLPWFSRPSTLLTTAALLLALFAASVWATLRGMARAGQAMRTRTDFLTGITHELKTPIASMRLIADVLHDDRDQLPEREQTRYLRMLTGEAARLTTLIDNVLDLGQIERGERAYDLQPDCFAAAVRETVHGYETLARHHGLTLELREGVAEAPTVLDRGAIAQALRNLLENARKYAGAGQRVVVSTERRGQSYVAAVRDHGPGIDPSERTRLFERFVRGGRHRDGSVPGVGLGLFLSREIARYHGGELQCVEPSDGPGAMFELTIPHRESR